MKRAILVTDLERAIIDKLRNGDVCLRAMICNTIDLPYSPEAFRYYLECIEQAAERHGESKGLKELEKEKARTMQKERERRFYMDGYTGAIEFGTGAAVPYFQINDGEIV